MASLSGLMSVTGKTVSSSALHAHASTEKKDSSSSSVFFSGFVLKACQVSDSCCCPVVLEMSKKLLAQLLRPWQTSGLLGLTTGDGVLSYLHEPNI